MGRKMPAEAGDVFFCDDRKWTWLEKYGRRRSDLCSFDSKKIIVEIVYGDVHFLQKCTSPVYNLDNILEMRNAINICGCHMAIPVIDCKCK